MTAEDAAHHFEGGFEMDGSFEDGEGAGGKNAGERSRVLALRARLFHDDGGRRRGHSAEEFEEARAAFGDAGGDFVFFEGEGQIDERDVNVGALEEAGGFAPAAHAPGLHTHRFKEAGEGVGPGFIAPRHRPGGGEQQVQPTGLAGDRSGVRGWARSLHVPGGMQAARRSRSAKTLGLGGGMRVFEGGAAATAPVRCPVGARVAGGEQAFQPGYLLKGLG